MRTIDTIGAKNSLIAAIKEHATWFTISMIGLILIGGIVIVNDPSKWWLGVSIAVGISLLLFTAINGRVVLKAIGSIFTLTVVVATSTMLGTMVASVPLYNLTWPGYLIATYLVALAYSYVVYSGRGRWVYLGFMSVFQLFFGIVLLMANADPHLTVIFSSIAALASFVIVYSLNGRTRISKNMPTGDFSEEFLKEIFKAADKMELEARLIPARRNLDSHILVYGDKSVFLYPIKMDQAFSAVGRKGANLGYLGKPINPWLLKLSFMTSISWKTKGANPALVMVDLNRKNGAESKVIGVTLPDSKRQAVVGIQAAPAMRTDREKYGETLIQNALNLMDDYNSPLSEKQKSALDKIGYSKSEIAELSSDEEKMKVE